MTSIPLQWKTLDAAAGNNTLDQTNGDNDFAFSAVESSGGAALPISVGNRYVHISPGTTETPTNAGVDKIIPTTSVLSVTFNAEKLKNLFEAETDGVNTRGALTFAERKVRIEALSTKPGRDFTEITLDLARNTTTPYGTDLLLGQAAPYLNTVIVPASASTNLDNITMTFKNNPVTLPNPTTNVLPDNNKDGHLIFELKYYAFGTAASGGSPWTIRNGLNSARDAKDKSEIVFTGDTYGGAFHLVFGAGDPDQRDETYLQVAKGL
jgi:hypothetical protein